MRLLCIEDVLCQVSGDQRLEQVSSQKREEEIMHPQGACDKSALVASVQNPSPTSEEQDQLLYTIIAPRDSTDIFYEFPGDDSN